MRCTRNALTSMPTAAERMTNASRALTAPSASTSDSPCSGKVETSRPTASESAISASREPTVWSPSGSPQKPRAGQNRPPLIVAPDAWLVKSGAAENSSLTSSATGVVAAGSGVKRPMPSVIVPTTPAGVAPAIFRTPGAAEQRARVGRDGRARRGERREATDAERHRADDAGGIRARDFQHTLRGGIGVRLDRAERARRAAIEPQHRGVPAQRQRERAEAIGPSGPVGDDRHVERHADERRHVARGVDGDRLRARGERRDGEREQHEGAAAHRVPPFPVTTRGVRSTGGESGTEPSGDVRKPEKSIVPAGPATKSPVVDVQPVKPPLHCGPSGAFHQLPCAFTVPAVAIHRIASNTFASKLLALMIDDSPPEPTKMPL